MKEQVLEALKELEDEANEIQGSSGLTSWKNKAVNFVIRIYGLDSAPIEQIKALEYWRAVHGNDNIAARKIEARNLIAGLIKDVLRFGLPEIRVAKEKGFNINITQNQTTKVSISLIIESIQDELTRGQLKELQEVISNNDISGEEKKSKIVDKLKSFGSDIASNIIANLLTNPAITG